MRPAFFPPAAFSFQTCKPPPTSSRHITLPVVSRYSPTMARDIPAFEPTASPSISKSLHCPDSRYACIEGTTVHYTLWPSHQPFPVPLIVCFHGFGASIFSFRALQKTLHKDNTILPATLLAYDAPGFGLTSRSSPLSRYTPNFSACIAQTLAAAHATTTPPVLLAHSMGALAACRTLLNNPTQVAAIVLIAPAILPATRLPKPVRAIARILAAGLARLVVALALLLSPLLAALLRFTFVPWKVWERALRLARGPTYPPSKSDVEGYRRPLHAAHWERGIINFCCAALLDRANALNRAEDFVHLIASLSNPPPVLIVHGEVDALVPLQNSKRIVSTLGDVAELVVMEGCGHVPHEEDPDTFARLVSHFLTRHRSV